MEIQTVLGCRDLKDQYSFLVEQSQALTHTEFLEAHAAEISVGKSLPSVPLPELSMLPPPPKAGSVTGGAVAKVVIREDEKQSIFMKHPALEQLYNATVPGMLTPADFWKRCFRSRYYLEAEGYDVLPGQKPDNLFDALARSESELSQRQPLQPSAADIAATVDVELDLTGNVDREKERAPARKTCKLISKLNEYSEAALAASMGSKASASSSPADDIATVVEHRRQSVRRSVETLRKELEASETQAKAPRLSLQIGQSGHAADRCTLSSSNKEGDARRAEALRAWGEGEVVSEERHLLERHYEAMRKEMREFTKKLLSKKESHDSAQQNDLNPQAMAEAAQVASKVKALVRHFWSSRRSEVDIRARLVDQLRGLRRTLEEWNRESQPHGGPKAWAAQSWLPPIRRAEAIHESLLQDDDRIMTVDDRIT
jgi:hypothetical protein